MIRLLKWLIFGHLHAWDEEERFTSRTLDPGYHPGPTFTVTVHEKCRCGVTRVRLIEH